MRCPAFEVTVGTVDSLTLKAKRFEFFSWRGARAFAVQRLPREVTITDLERGCEIYLEPSRKVLEEAERYRCRPKRDKVMERILNFDGLTHGFMDLEPLCDRTRVLVDLGLPHQEAIDQAKAEALMLRQAA